MKITALLTSLALSLMVSGAFAEEKAAAELKADADAEVKAAIEAAHAANEVASKAGFEWFWDEKSASEHLQDAINAANEDDNEKALKLAKAVENAGNRAQEQAEMAKNVEPRI